PTEVWVAFLQVEQVARKTEEAEKLAMEAGENQNRGNRREICQDSVFNPLTNIKCFTGRAETAQQRADVGILPKFQNGNRAEHQRHCQPEEAGHRAAPLRLPGLEIFEF